MLVSASRNSHKRVDSSGRVEMIYAAHCMDEDKREDLERAEMLTTAKPEFIAAAAAVLKLLNHFNTFYTKSLTSSSVYAPASYIDALFNDVFPLATGKYNAPAGLFPDCAPPSLLIKDYADAFEPTGWEAVKCFVRL